MRSSIFCSPKAVRGCELPNNRSFSLSLPRGSRKEATWFHTYFTLASRVAQVEGAVRPRETSGCGFALISELSTFPWRVLTYATQGQNRGFSLAPPNRNHSKHSSDTFACGTNDANEARKLVSSWPLNTLSIVQSPLQVLGNCNPGMPASFPGLQKEKQRSVCLREPPPKRTVGHKCWFSFWFPFQHQEGYPQKRHTHMASPVVPCLCSWSPKSGSIHSQELSLLRRFGLHVQQSKPSKHAPMDMARVGFLLVFVADIDI